MKEYNAYKSDRRTVRDVLFLLGIAIALGFGLALASPALGAAPQQSAEGDISGTITVAGGNAAGITVELRQRANNGADNLLATTTTDENGVYHFSKQASAPNDAYYQVKVSGGSGTLAVWYSFPIIYLSGQNFSVPSIEMADVKLLAPKDGGQVVLPAKLVWQARRSGETFRVYVYNAADMGKALLDSGSLGMNNEYALPDGALAPGNYEAVVQVRDAVVGYGVSMAHFRFSVVTSVEGTSLDATPEVITSENTPEAQPQVEPTAAPDVQPSGQPELDLKLTADKTEVQQGDTITFHIEVANKGSVIAPDVVVTDKLPAGVTVDGALAKSSVGLVSVDGNSVTAQLGNLAPGAKVAIDIPVLVAGTGVTNVSNQVSALYTGAANPALSNAYIAQVSQLEAPPAQATETAVPVPAATEAPAPDAPSEPGEAQPFATEPAPPVVVEPTAVAVEPTAVAVVEAPAPTQAVVAPAATAKPAGGAAGSGGGTNQTPKAPIPQTGGSFPLTFALLLLAATIAARYLRGYLRSRSGRRM